MRNIALQRRANILLALSLVLLAGGVLSSCQKAAPRPNVPLPQGVLPFRDVYLGASQDSLVRKYGLRQDPATDLWTGFQFPSREYPYIVTYGFEDGRLTDLELIRHVRQGESSDSLARVLVALCKEAYGRPFRIAELNMVEFLEPIILWQPKEGAAVKVRYTTDAIRREHRLAYPWIGFQIQFADTLPAASQHFNAANLGIEDIVGK